MMQSHNIIWNPELDEWHWSRQAPNSIPVPDYIQLRASGKAMTKDGLVYLKCPGPDPALTALLHKRLNDAFAKMEESMSKNLYGEV